MAGVQGFITLLLTVAMLWASLFVSETNGQTSPCGSLNCPRIYDPVCGSNGKTYSNECGLNVDRQCRNPSLYKRHDGACVQTTTACTIGCLTYYSPVCGSNGVTYSNICFLNAARTCRDPSLYKRYDGPCLFTTTPCVSPCVLIYQPVCGSDGETYGNLCELDNERRCRNPYLIKLHDGECRGGSGDCDKPCPDHDQPICGTNDVTYANYCLFEIAKCKWNIGISKMNSPCSSAIKPTASTLMAMMALLGSILLVLL